MRLALRLVLCHLGIALFLPWQAMCQYGGYGAQKTEYSPVIPPSDDPYYTPPDIPHPLREERKPEAIRSHHAPVAPAAPSNKSSGPNLPIHLPSSITSSQSTSQQVAPPANQKFKEEPKPNTYKVPIQFTIKNLGQNPDIPGFNNKPKGGAAGVFREESSGSAATGAGGQSGAGGQASAATGVGGQSGAASSGQASSGGLGGQSGSASSSSSGGQGSGTSGSAGGTGVVMGGGSYGPAAITPQENLGGASSGGSGAQSGGASAGGTSAAGSGLGEEQTQVAGAASSSEAPDAYASSGGAEAGTESSLSGAAPASTDTEAAGGSSSSSSSGPPNLLTGSNFESSNGLVAAQTGSSSSSSSGSQTGENSENQSGQSGSSSSSNQIENSSSGGQSGASAPSSSSVPASAVPPQGHVPVTASSHEIEYEDEIEAEKSETFKHREESSNEASSSGSASSSGGYSEKTGSPPLAIPDQFPQVAPQAPTQNALSALKTSGSRLDKYGQPEPAAPGEVQVSPSSQTLEASAAGDEYEKSLLGGESSSLGARVVSSSSSISSSSSSSSRVSTSNTYEKQVVSVSSSGSGGPSLSGSSGKSSLTGPSGPGQTHSVDPSPAAPSEGSSGQPPALLGTGTIPPSAPISNTANGPSHGSIATVTTSRSGEFEYSEETNEPGTEISSSLPPLLNAASASIFYASSQNAFSTKNSYTSFTKPPGYEEASDKPKTISDFFIFTASPLSRAYSWSGTPITDTTIFSSKASEGAKTMKSYDTPTITQTPSAPEISNTTPGFSSTLYNEDIKTAEIFSTTTTLRPPPGMLEFSNSYSAPPSVKPPSNPGRPQPAPPAIKPPGHDQNLYIQQEHIEYANFKQEPATAFNKDGFNSTYLIPPTPPVAQIPVMQHRETASPDSSSTLSGIDLAEEYEKSLVSDLRYESSKTIIHPIETTQTSSPNDVVITYGSETNAAKVTSFPSSTTTSGETNTPSHGVLGAVAAENYEQNYFVDDIHSRTTGLSSKTTSVTNQAPTSSSSPPSFSTTSSNSYESNSEAYKPSGASLAEEYEKNFEKNEPPPSIKVSNKPIEVPIQEKPSRTEIEVQPTKEEPSSYENKAAPEALVTSKSPETTSFPTTSPSKPIDSRLNKSSNAYPGTYAIWAATALPEAPSTISEASSTRYSGLPSPYVSQSPSGQYLSGAISAAEEYERDLASESSKRIFPVVTQPPPVDVPPSTISTTGQFLPHSENVDKSSELPSPDGSRASFEASSAAEEYEKDLTSSNQAQVPSAAPQPPNLAVPASTTSAPSQSWSTPSVSSVSNSNNQLSPDKFIGLPSPYGSQDNAQHFSGASSAAEEYEKDLTSSNQAQVPSAAPQPPKLAVPASTTSAPGQSWSTPSVSSISNSNNQLPLDKFIGVPSPYGSQDNAQHSSEAISAAEEYEKDLTSSNQAQVPSAAPQPPNLAVPASSVPALGFVYTQLSNEFSSTTPSHTTIPSPGSTNKNIYEKISAHPINSQINNQLWQEISAALQNKNKYETKTNDGDLYGDKTSQTTRPTTTSTYPTNDLYQSSDLGGEKSSTSLYTDPSLSIKPEGYSIPELIPSQVGSIEPDKKEIEVAPAKTTKEEESYGNEIEKNQKSTEIPTTTWAYPIRPILNNHYRSSEKSPTSLEKTPGDQPGDDSTPWLNSSSSHVSGYESNKPAQGMEELEMAPAEAIEEESGYGNEVVPNGWQLGQSETETGHIPEQNLTPIPSQIGYSTPNLIPGSSIVGGNLENEDGQLGEVYTPVSDQGYKVTVPNSQVYPSSPSPISKLAPDGTPKPPSISPYSKIGATLPPEIYENFENELLQALHNQYEIKKELYKPSTVSVPTVTSSIQPPQSFVSASSTENENPSEFGYSEQEESEQGSTTPSSLLGSASTRVTETANPSNQEQVYPSQTTIPEEIHPSASTTIKLIDLITTTRGPEDVFPTRTKLPLRTKMGPEQVNPSSVEDESLYDEDVESVFVDENREKIPYMTASTLKPPPTSDKPRITLRKCKFDISTKKCTFDEKIETHPHPESGLSTSYLGQVFDGELTDEEAIKEVLRLAQSLDNEYLDLRSLGAQPSGPAPPAIAPNDYDRFEPEIIPIGPVGPVGTTQSNQPIQLLQPIYTDHSTQPQIAPTAPVAQPPSNLGYTDLAGLEPSAQVPGSALQSLIRPSISLSQHLTAKPEAPQSVEEEGEEVESGPEGYEKSVLPVSVPAPAPNPSLGVYGTDQDLFNGKSAPNVPAPAPPVSTQIEPESPYETVQPAAPRPGPAAPPQLPRFTAPSVNPPIPTEPESPYETVQPAQAPQPQKPAPTGTISRPSLPVPPAPAQKLTPNKKISSVPSSKEGGEVEYEYEEETEDHAPAPSAPAPISSPSPAPSSQTPEEIHEGVYSGPSQPTNPSSYSVPAPAPAPAPQAPPSATNHETSYEGTGPAKEEEHGKSSNFVPQSFPIAKNPLNVTATPPEAWTIHVGAARELEEYGPAPPDLRIPPQKINVPPSNYEEEDYDEETENEIYPLVDSDKLGQAGYTDITNPVEGAVPPAQIRNEVETVDAGREYPEEVQPKHTAISGEAEEEEEPEPVDGSSQPHTVSGGGTQVSDRGPAIPSQEVVYVPDDEEEPQHRSEGPSEPAEIPAVPAPAPAVPAPAPQPSGSFSSLPAAQPAPQQPYQPQIQVPSAPHPAPFVPQQPFQPAPQQTFQPAPQQTYQPQPPPLHVPAPQPSFPQVPSFPSQPQGGGGGYPQGGGGGGCGGGGGGCGFNRGGGGCGGGNSCGGGGFNRGGGGCGGGSCGGGFNGGNNNNGCCGGNWFSRSGGFCQPVNFNPCGGGGGGGGGCGSGGCGGGGFGGGGGGGGCGQSGCSSQRSFLGSPCPPAPSCPQTIIINISCARGCNPCSEPRLPPPPCLPGCPCPRSCPHPVQQCCCPSPSPFNCGGRGGCLALLANRARRIK